MNGIPLLLLFIYSGFTMNLVLQCGLGVRGAATSKGALDAALVVKTAIIFLSVILLWLLFSKVIYSITSGVLIYVLLFPVSSIIYNGLEFLIFRFLLEKDAQDDSFISFPCGITSVCAFLCINIAGNFLQAAVLSFGFTAGIFLVNLIIREVRKRAALENVPLFLRGKPLVLITMGLLSLIFSTASLLIFRMIGTG